MTTKLHLPRIRVSSFEKYEVTHHSKHQLLQLSTKFSNFEGPGAPQT